MKTLLLLRHQDAGAAPGGNDKVRELTPKGALDAQALGKLMARGKLLPGLTLCSSATRTTQTFQRAQENCGTPLKCEYTNQLYDARQGDIFEVIQNCDDKTDMLMIIAHNPGIYELSVQLRSDGPESLMKKLLTGGFRPGSLAVLECPIENWADLKPGENTLANLLDPLDYNAPDTPARWT